MPRVNRVKEAIDRYFEAEVMKLPKFKKLPKGQKEVAKGKFIEYMIGDLVFGFLETDDLDKKVMVARFLADYGGYKPSVEIKNTISENPYEGMDEAELELAEKELLEYGGESGEVEPAEVIEDSERKE